MNTGEEWAASRPAPPKLGLALSGGGFRASFFHLGVLAQLAKEGILRHVQVLSTVSGGSIIGARYYIEVKNLLEGKCDEDIEDDDYVHILERMEIDFLEKVQKNPRMLTFENYGKAMRMFRLDYSRSDRMGEIYDDLFYRPVMMNRKFSGPVQMRELRIEPRLPGGALQKDFDPNVHNSERKAKIPILLLNATVLNNGHNWRFEAVRMGTPPRTREDELDIDKNCRLLRAHSYDMIAEHQQNIELGLAVAASACVPGIFHPLAISGLYDEGVRVQLVDGGVHDNQGVQGLLERNCSVIMVSDASGQMQDEAEPATRIPNVTSRSLSITMDRVREEQLLQLARSKDLKMALVHLRRGVESKKIRWLGSGGEPHAGEGEASPEDSSMEFGVHPRVQELLSQVRTDLDSFTDVEARSLMMDGYLMTQWELKRQGAFKELVDPGMGSAREDWKFLEMAPWMSRPDPSPDYLKHLEVAGKRTFKVFHLNPVVSLPMAAAAIAVLAWLLLYSPLADASLQTSLRQVTLFAAVLLGGFFAPTLTRTYKALRFLHTPVHTLVTLFTRAILPVLVVPMVKLHLRYIDPWFLRSGRISRLGKK